MEYISKYEKKVRKQIMAESRSKRIPTRNPKRIRPVFHTCSNCKKRKVENHHFLCDFCWREKQIKKQREKSKSSTNKDRIERRFKKMTEEKQYKDVEGEIFLFPNVGDAISGIYKSKDVEVGENKANVYHLETSEGKIVSFWGSTVLDKKMELISIGDDIRVVYEGKVTPDKGKEYKNFKVQRATN